MKNTFMHEQSKPMILHVSLQRHKKTVQMNLALGNLNSQRFQSFVPPIVWQYF